MTETCSHPVSQRSTTIRETWFEIVTTVTCLCGAVVSETRVPKIQPTDPGTR